MQRNSECTRVLENMLEAAERGEGPAPQDAAHLALCPACAAASARLEEFEAGLRSAMACAPPSARGVDSVMAELGERGHPWSRSFPRWSEPAIYSVCFLLLLAFFTLNEGRLVIRPFVPQFERITQFVEGLSRWSGTMREAGMISTSGWTLGISAIIAMIMLGVWLINSTTLIRLFHPPRSTRN